MAEYNGNQLADPAPDLASSMPRIADFYAGCNILLTGGSGFLGKLLIEKILRSCPNVNNVYLILRAKKGKTPIERFEELFKDVVFDHLKKEQPGFVRKIVLIAGDMMQSGLDLTTEDRELLRSTNIVIHGAATVRFDDSMRTSASINVRGTKELLLLANEMANLKAFVHISTAYSNCVRQEIDEKFYPSPMDSEKLLSLLDTLDDVCLEHLTPILLNKWPNTYAFTKAVAEDTVRHNGQTLPVCIVRPSVVIATFKEPLAGWINNVYGATGVMVGAGLGLLRTLHCDADLVADLIPADYVVNTVIAAAVDIGQSRTMNIDNLDNPTALKIAEPAVYNAVSSCQNPLTWGRLLEYTKEHGMQIPSTMCIWYYCFRLNKYRWLHNLYVIFLHLIPAAIVDSLAWITGRTPMLWTAYRKIHKFSSVIEYFTLQQWRFHNNNVQQLWKRLNPADRNEFDFDVGSFSWYDYSYNHIRGVRAYLLKDPLDTLTQGKAKYVKLKVAHYTLITAVCGILLWLLWTILRFFSSW